MIIEADGGSRGNPGPAGYGAVVRDTDGSVLAERAGFLGRTTNNVAEYEGLLAGLRAAIEFGATRVEARLDSKLVVEQMSGRWQIKHPALRPLAATARELLGELACPVTFTWIPRARNAHADKLANEAMDTRAGVHRDLVPPTPAPSASTSPPEPVAKSVRESSDPNGESSLFDVPAEEAVTTRPIRSWTANTDTPTTLILVRHGQTAMSVDRRYSGVSDPQLTPLGHDQAKALAARLSTLEEITAVITSPLARARSTAAPIADAHGGVPIVHPGLIETDFGAWEGLTFGEADERDPRLHRAWLSDPAVAPPDGESFERVWARVTAAVTELIDAHRGGTLILVSHVTPIKCAIRHALATGPEFLYRTRLDLASVSVTEFYPDANATLSLFNDTSHLPG